MNKRNKVIFFLCRAYTAMTRFFLSHRIPIANGIQQECFTIRSMQRILLFFITIFITFSALAQKKISPGQTGILKVSFINTVNGVPLVLNDSVYSNPFGETYRISKLKYYISNLRAKNTGIAQKERNSYHLLNAADTTSTGFGFSLKPGNYSTLEFLLGVDSLRNCSGAQTGALDPMNDMFWTWNSGYVMFKLEGSSPASGQLNNRIEYHIGGYSGMNKVIKKISLQSSFEIEAGKTTTLFIETDINKIWKGPYDISITRTPVCATTGPLARRIADNYNNMFSLKKVTVSKP